MQKLLGRFFKLRIYFNKVRKYTYGLQLMQAVALDCLEEALHGFGCITAMGENLFYSPSVFNYYPPDYALPATTLVGPEFATLNSSVALTRVNFIYALVYTNTIAPDATVQNAIGTTFSLSSLQALANDPAAMADKLNAVMLHGTMSAQMKTSIVQAVSTVPATDALNRARIAAYLVATSSQYQVER